MMTCVILKLAYEPVSAELQCTVAGRIMSPNRDVEIKIEAEGGFWTSGWIKPVTAYSKHPYRLRKVQSRRFGSTPVMDMGVYWIPTQLNLKSGMGLCRRRRLCLTRSPLKF